MKLGPSGFLRTLEPCTTLSEQLRREPARAAVGGNRKPRLSVCVCPCRLPYLRGAVILACGDFGTGVFVSCNPYRAIPPARIDAASTRVRPTLGQVCFSSTLASIYRRASARAAAASGVRTYDEFATDAAESPMLAKKKAASASACNVNNALFWQSCEMSRFFVTLLTEPTRFLPTGCRSAPGLRCLTPIRPLASFPVVLQNCCGTENFVFMVRSTENGRRGSFDRVS